VLVDTSVVEVYAQGGRAISTTQCLFQFYNKCITHGAKLKGKFQHLNGMCVAPSRYIPASANNTGVALELGKKMESAFIEVYGMGSAYAQA
jgi:hypothetical protein